jgi:DNA-binding NarL/FixJ family response regulator
MHFQTIQMKFYETKKFVAIQKKWEEKLAKEGFQDIDKQAASKSGNRHTLACQNHVAIHAFFRRLDCFLNTSETLPPIHKTILKMYSDGRMIKDICKAVNKGRTTVKAVISNYRKLLTGRL